MSGAGGFSWFGAIAGWAAPLIVGTFVVLGARRRRSYDAWRDTMTELGDGTDAVATAFVLVNLVVAGMLGILAAAAQNALHSWTITIAVIVAAVGSFVFGLTACEKRCRYPRCEGKAPRWLHGLHLLAAGIVVADIIAAPFLTWFALQHRGGAFTVFRYVSLALGSAAAVLTAVMLQQASVKKRADRAKQASSAVPGLFERLVWVMGYGWVVVLACTLVHPGWPSALALGLWLAVALRFVLRPDWRDPSPQFSLTECQPGTLSPLGKATHGMLWVGTVENSRAFLGELRTALDNQPPLIGGTTGDATRAVTIAFTANGLRKLGVHYCWHAPFVEDAFNEGMLARAEELGDTGRSDPTHWDRGWRDPNLHVAFWIQSAITTQPAAATTEAADGQAEAAYAEANAAAERERDALVDLVASHFTSVEERLRVATNRLGRKSREHFGFVDGLSQPWIDGIEESKRRDGGKLDARGRSKPLALGEFVVGQVDETGDIFPVPDPPEVFLGGTFLVVRKLEQDVAAFHNYAGADDAANTLAARLTGRDGEGVALGDPSAKDGNDFTYGDDPEGVHCPLGAHIRRTNPRDALGFGSTLSARRRIIRRGMPYGSPWNEGDENAHRGLLFLACNVRIAEQFEFIQKQWLNDASPFGLGNIPDPISGLWPPGSQRPLVVTGVQPRVAVDLPSFVTTKGGEYFFVPSVSGLCALAASRPEPRRTG